MSSETNIPSRRTRAANAGAHPGQVVLNATRKRRTRAEIAADKKRIQEELEAKEATALEGIKRLANIQADMEETQSSVATRNPKGVRPRPVPVKKKLASLPEGTSRAVDASDQVEGKFALRMMGNSQWIQDMDVDEVDILMDVEEIENVPKPSQRVIKPSLKDAVNAARLRMIRGVQDNNQVKACVTSDGKGKSLPVASYVDLLSPCCYSQNQRSSSLT
jgi:hypothetical protein